MTFRSGNSFAVLRPFGRNIGAPSNSGLALQITGVFLRRPIFLKLASVFTRGAQLLGWIAYTGINGLESEPRAVADARPAPQKTVPSVPPPEITRRAGEVQDPNHETTILLVDDDPGVLKSLARLLRAHGWNVITASDGAEALLQLNDRAPDLLITDLSMGDISGWDLLFHEDLQRPSLPVFVITALPVPEVSGADALAAEFFQKPLDLDALVMAIRRRLGPPETHSHTESKT